MKYVDAHCHLGESGVVPCDGVVSHFICNAARVTDWDNVLRVCDVCPNVSGAIGLHPWYIDDAPHNWADRLSDILSRTPDIMIGECGLDRARGDFNTQMGIFRQQIDLAVKYNRTLHLHCVRAWDAVLHVLRDYSRPPRIVAHSFSGNADIAHRISGICDVYFSFSDRFLSPAVLDVIDNTRILTESDRTPSESAAIIPGIVAQIAQIKSVDIDKMAGIIYENSMRVIDNGQITQN